MAKLAYLLSPKLSDAATFSSSATVGNGGVSNLQDPRPRYRAVFSSASPYIEIDFGAATTVNALGIGFINSASASDTFQLRGKATYPVTSSPTVDSTALTIWPGGSSLSNYAEIHRAYAFNGSSLRYWRIDFNCSQAVQIGRLLLGQRIEPAAGVSLGWVPGSREPIAATVDLGGGETRRPMGGPGRNVRVAWPKLTSTEAFASMEEMLLERGSARDFMLVVDQDAAQGVTPMPYLYIGCAPDGLETQQVTYDGTFTRELEVTELAPIRMA